MRHLFRHGLRRAWCDLRGCVDSHNYGACDRCGCDYYEGFYEYGRLDWVLRATRRAKWLLFQSWKRRHCEVCQKPIRGFRYHEFTCSNECFDQWIPF